MRLGYDPTAMEGGDTFEERTVRFAQPVAHYAIVVAPDGRYLGVDADGATQVTETISDDLMWRRRGTRLEHPRSTVVLESAAADEDRWRLSCAGTPLEADGERGSSGALFYIARGPERLPSEYLEHLKTHGWVVLAAILPPDITGLLQRIACTDGVHQAPGRDGLQTRRPLPRPRAARRLGRGGRGLPTKLPRRQRPTVQRARRRCDRGPGRNPGGSTPLR